MGWVTSESPVGCADDATCEHEGCKALAHVRFVSVNGEQRRSSGRCSSHAEVLRRKVSPKRPIAGAEASDLAEPVSPDEARITEALQTPVATPQQRAKIVYQIPIDAPVGLCKSCSAGIAWINTPGGKHMPVDTDGTPHWATCPTANQHGFTATTRQLRAYVVPLITSA